MVLKLFSLTLLVIGQQEIENFVLPNARESKNDAGETPHMIFTEEHKELKKEGEKWMRNTASSCILVAALIVTVVFAAAITVPGGNDQSKGVPIWSKQIAFILFAISDAISLFTSTTSLLLFLSLWTSRYAEEDFLSILPKRLIIGLLTLFLSITFMMHGSIQCHSLSCVLAKGGRGYLYQCLDWPVSQSLPLYSCSFPFSWM